MTSGFRTNETQQFQRGHHIDPSVSDSNDSERSRPDTQTGGFPFMSSLTMRSFAGALAGPSPALWLPPAFPPPFCGPRFSPATLAIDDPGVLDELTLPVV